MESIVIYNDFKGIMVIWAGWTYTFHYCTDGSECGEWIVDIHTSRFADGHYTISDPSF